MKKPKLLISGLAVMLLLSGCGIHKHITKTGSQANTSEKLFNLSNKKLYAKYHGAIGVDNYGAGNMVYLNTKVNSSNSNKLAKNAWKLLQPTLKKKNYRPTDKVIVSKGVETSSHNEEYRQIATGNTNGDNLNFNVSHKLTNESSR